MTSDVVGAAVARQLSLTDGETNAWILKPGTNSKGSGIHVSRDRAHIAKECRTL